MNTTPVSSWCGLCSEYTDHDTSHHGGGSGIVRGDIVRKKSDGSPVPRTGRVEEARGQRARVAWRGLHGRTETEWEDRDSLLLVP